MGCRQQKRGGRSIGTIRNVDWLFINSSLYLKDRSIGEKVLYDEPHIFGFCGEESGEWIDELLISVVLCDRYVVNFHMSFYHVVVLE